MHAILSSIQRRKRTSGTNHLRFFLTTFHERIIQIPWDTSGFTSNHPRISLACFLSRFFLASSCSRNSVVFSFRAWPTETRLYFYPPRAEMVMGGKNWLGCRYCDDTLIVVVVVTRVLEKHYPKHAIKFHTPRRRSPVRNPQDNVIITRLSRFYYRDRCENL